ncbi:MAG TPA: alpha/beta hydrolase [Solirubrobacteraceae bacterium]|nr:alpha/beta hydrolase [Solirubrobacteraceae bacterium]
MSARGTAAPPRRSAAGDAIERAVVRVLLGLPRAVKRRLAGAPLRRDGLDLDLDTQLVLRLAERDPDPPLSTLTPLQARAQLQRSVSLVAGRPAQLAEIREVSLTGPAGPLRARLYVPGETIAGGAPLLVYYHGGGWVVGDLDTHDEVCRTLSLAAGARILSVDYRLAPENPFPAAVEDALAAFRDAVARAAELGADPARIAVGGDSAGGHLAAVTAQLARSDPQPPAFQLLIYPVTDCLEVSASRVAFGEGFLLTKENMDWYEENFIGPADRGDARISPLLAESLAGVAPAMVVTAGFDPLRDEGEAYARRLAQDGVRVSLRRHPGFVHGFTHMMVGGSGPREAIAEMGGALRSALAQPSLVTEPA